MISARLKIWLAAEAGGDLSPEQSRRVREYLKRNAEAAQYFSALLDDRRKLSRFARHAAGEGLAEPVLPANRFQNVPISQASVRRANGRRRLVAGVTIAASVLTIAVLAATFWPDSDAPLRRPILVPQPIAAIQPKSEPKFVRPKPADTPPTNSRIDPSGRSDPDDQTAPPTPTVQQVDPAVVRTERVQRQPISPPQRQLMVEVSEIADPETGRQLVAHLRHGLDHALELSAKDTSRALEELARLLRLRGVVVIVDSHIVSPRTRHKQLYAIYTEALAPIEVLELLRRLGRRPGGASDSEPVYSRLVSSPIDDAVRHDVVAVLGLDPFGPANVRPTKPETMTSLEAGHKAKLSTGRPPALLAYVGPAHQRSTVKNPSREAQVFLERRSKQPGGKLRLYISIRPE